MSLPPPPDGSSPPPFQQPYPPQQPYPQAPQPPQAPFAPQPGYPPQQHPPQPGYPPQQPQYAPQQQWGQQPAYPTYTPPPLKVARPPLVVLAMMCAIAVGAGSVLSWVHLNLADAVGVPTEYGGLHKDGKFTIVMAAIVIGAMIISLSRQVSWPMITGTVMFGLCVGIALIDIADVQTTNSDLGLIGGGSALSTGVGLWLVLIGAIVCVIGLITRAAPTT